MCPERKVKRSVGLRRHVAYRRLRPGWFRSPKAIASRADLKPTDQPWLKRKATTSSNTCSGCRFLLLSFCHPGDNFSILKFTGYAGRPLSDDHVQRPFYIGNLRAIRPFVPHVRCNQVLAHRVISPRCRIWSLSGAQRTSSKPHQSRSDYECAS